IIASERAGLPAGTYAPIARSHPISSLPCVWICARRHARDAMTVTRAFLCWTAGLATTSWVGITLAELGHFSAWVALVAGVATAYRLARPREPGIPGGGLVVGCVVAALCSLFPTVDTTLLSQDASVHLAAGRWLDRTGSLAIGDPTLDGLSEQTRLELFEIS